MTRKRKAPLVVWVSINDQGNDCVYAHVGPTRRAAKVWHDIEPVRYIRAPLRKKRSKAK